MSDMPSKAQAYRLAELWASRDRFVNIMTAVPEGREVYNDATLVALKRRGWIGPDGYGEQPCPSPPYAEGCRQEGHLLTFAGMEALKRYLDKEIELSRGDDP